MDALLRRRAMIASGGSPTPPTPALVFYDRLVFDGTAYIETGITPPADASFLVRLGNESLKATQRGFNCPTSTGVIGMNYANGTTSTTRYFNVYYGQSSAVSTNRNLAFSTTSYYFFLTPKRFGWGSTAYTITRGAENPNGHLSLGSNNSHTGQPYTGRMGTFKIYGSDAQNCASTSDFSNYTPVYTLRPCTYNGEAGMWCEETSTFYGNTAGAGTLSVLNDE